MKLKLKDHQLNDIFTLIDADGDGELSVDKLHAAGRSGGGKGGERVLYTVSLNKSVSPLHNLRHGTLEEARESVGSDRRLVAKLSSDSVVLKVLQERRLGAQTWLRLDYEGRTDVWTLQRDGDQSGKDFLKKRADFEAAHFEVSGDSDSDSEEDSEEDETLLCLPLHASEEMSRTLGAEAQLQAASAGNVELLEFVRHACAEDWLGIDAVGSGGRTPLFAACMALGGLRGARACFCHPAGWVGNALTDAAAPGPQAPGAGRLRTRFGMVPRAR